MYEWNNLPQTNNENTDPQFNARVNTLSGEGQWSSSWHFCLEAWEGSLLCCQAEKKIRQAKQQQFHSVEDIFANPLKCVEAFLDEDLTTL